MNERVFLCLTDDGSIAAEEQKVIAKTGRLFFFSGELLQEMTEEVHLQQDEMSESTSVCLIIQTWHLCPLNRAKFVSRRL